MVVLARVLIRRAVRGNVRRALRRGADGSWLLRLPLVTLALLALACLARARLR